MLQLPLLTTTTLSDYLKQNPEVKQKHSDVISTPEESWGFDNPYTKASGRLDSGNVQNIDQVLTKHVKYCFVLADSISGDLPYHDMCGESAKRLFKEGKIKAYDSDGNVVTGSEITARANNERLYLQGEGLVKMILEDIAQRGAPEVVAAKTQAKERTTRQSTRAREAVRATTVSAVAARELRQEIERSRQGATYTTIKPQLTEEDEGVLYHNSRGLKESVRDIQDHGREWEQLGREDYFELKQFAEITDYKEAKQYYKEHFDVRGTVTKKQIERTYALAREMQYYEDRLHVNLGDKTIEEAYRLIQDEIDKIGLSKTEEVRKNATTPNARPKPASATKPSSRGGHYSWQTYTYPYRGRYTGTKGGRHLYHKDNRASRG